MNSSSAQETAMKASTENRKVYSYHTFTLPFSWESPETDGSREFRRLYGEWQDRYDNDPNWHEMYSAADGEFLLSPDISCRDFYSEYMHFHPYIRETIYGCSDTGGMMFDDHAIVKCYTLRPGGKKISGTYTVKKGSASYSLDVTRIELRIYNTGIGIYSLECENRDAGQADPEAIRKINDLGSRITKRSYDNPLCADRLTLDIRDLGTFTEDWSDSVDPMIADGKVEAISYISRTVTGVMGIETGDIRTGSNNNMLVMTWTGGEACIATPYGEIPLTGAGSEESAVFRAVCSRTAVLCIAQRASLMNFSRRAELVSRRIVAHGNNMSVSDRERMINLHERYVAFLTQMDASEISSLQEISEVYEKLRDLLKISREKECVREKMDGLSALATAEQDFDFNTWAAAVAVAALLMTAGGLICDSFANKISPWITGGAVVLPALTAFLSIGLGLIIGLMLKRRG